VKQCAQGQNIMAGPNEKTLLENYSLEIELPADEGQFLKAITAVGLRYTAIGGSAPMPVSRPRFCKNFDMTSIARGYMVHGEYDAASNRKEQYLVLLTSSNQVVYIENRFQYSP
jgi:hypothetical protein